MVLDILAMNHRPTLEGKRGYEKTIKDTIQHARLLKGHTRLKYRQDLPKDESEGNKKRVKRKDVENKTEETEEEIQDARYMKIAEDSESNENTSHELALADKTVQRYSIKELEATKDKETGSERDSDSDSELDSDSEAMRAELEIIRKEKEANSLVKEHPGSKKSSWRSRPFAKKQVLTDAKYTTNTMASSQHKHFLSRYIR